jgi:biopolymer transport protein ExbD
MITHPLDLDSKLRAPPRAFDWVFFVNIALIGMFFLFFGSRFILSPVVKLPARHASQISYLPGTVVISVKANGQIFTDTGLVSKEQLKAWLAEKRKNSPDASLLVRQDAGVDTGTILDIQGMAEDAGFKLVSVLVDPVPERAGAPAAGAPGR